MKPSFCLREVFGGGRRWNAECALQVFDEMTLWRWKVMSLTSTTMSLGNPVVQNLQRRDFEASFDELVHCFQMGLQQKYQKVRFLNWIWPLNSPCLAFGAWFLSCRRCLWCCHFLGKSLCICLLSERKPFWVGNQKPKSMKETNGERDWLQFTETTERLKE